MPDFNLSDAEAHALAAYLRHASDATLPAATPGDAKAGRALAAQSGCVHCHAAPVEPTLQAKPWHALSQGTCSHTRYDFTPEQTSDLAAFMSRPQASFEEKVLAEAAERAVTQLQCIACHKRDDASDLWSRYKMETKDLAIEHADRGHLAQDIPSLTWAGDKLHRDWLARLLKGELDYKTRPWLLARMPAFPGYADDLAAGLADQSGVSRDRSGDAAAADLSAVGETLVGATGFGCIICHAVGDTKAIAAFEVAGPNLGFTHDRLRKDFYHRWMMDPQRLDPGTKMPKYAGDDGKTSLQMHLDGDAAKQFKAIREYLRTVPAKSEPASE